jgi:hypothetical protein
MDAAIVGAAALVMFGVLRKRVTDLERTLTRLQGRLDDIERRPLAPPAPAQAPAAPEPASAPSEPIDIEPFVE